MIPAVIDAGVALAALLEEENRALASLDLVAVAALAERKSRAVDRFVAAEQTLRKAASPAAAAERAALRALGERLFGLADANRRMLERAVAAQESLLRLLVEAARPTDARYARSAARPRGRDLPALSLSAQV
ncbi:MAG: hypothetical protein NZ523_02280 [Elioraea sp.]|nr:hypothetical protein [Elioraea sp.]